MGIGASIFLIAVGAILAFAVTATVSGIDLATVGWILMGVGVVGLLMTMMIFGRRDRGAHRDEVPPRDPPVY
jgi:Flp pilus assembly protein protease CpaA